jgi:hypothetical protein
MPRDQVSAPFWSAAAPCKNGAMVIDDGIGMVIERGLPVERADPCAWLAIPL